MLQMDIPKMGLYRHFKGGYYFLMNVLRNEDGEYPLLQYVDIFHPELGYFARPVPQWNEDVSDRKDNMTGQIYRFERVVSIDNGISNFTTEQLMRELQVRENSPLQDLDIEEVSGRVFSRDYCIGEAYEETEDYPQGVSVNEVFDTKEEAFKYMNTHAKNRRFKIFRRVFIEETHL